MSLNQYLAPQFSGELCQDVINTIQAEYQKSDGLIEYWSGLSLQTADENDLMAAGYIVGYPWPSASASTFASNAFALSSASSFPESSSIGLSAADGSESGGVLTSASGSPTDGLIPIDVYRLLLDRVAYLKFNGLTWKSIDNLASSFGTYELIIPQERYFLFGTASAFPVTSPAHGFGGVGLTTGGLFSSVNPSYYPDSDISIGFSPSITVANLWILQSIFLAACTAPQVFVQNGV